MTKQALIIFVRKPEKGKVKTRLAATLGEEAALFIYQKLLQHTVEITEAVAADKLVFYAGEIERDDRWQRKNYLKQQQADGNLGKRMKAAFEAAFALGYKKVCIVGSDCFELTSAIIEQAFQSLKDKDLVIGPAKDGGYYLLGMKRLYSTLFINKNWSTATVFADTMDDAKGRGLSYKKLPQLTDVDEAKDVPKEWLTEVEK